MKLVHLSDLHFPVPLPISSLKGKMIPGYINYTFRRRKKYPILLWDAILRKVEEIRPDAVIISGDITNVSHWKEYEHALEYLRPLLGDKTFMIPGNHDRYTIKAAGKEAEPPYYEKFFSPWMGETVASAPGYLRTKKIGSLTLVGWDSNMPLFILDAFGYVQKEIAEATLRYLEREKIRDYILVCHHPIWNPPENQESYSHKMRNRDEIAELLQSKPPLAYLHGHVHTNWVKAPDPEKPYYVINSASSTRILDTKHQSGFHVLDYDGKSVSVQRYAFSNDKREFIESQTILY
ncbi:phosphohydrolase [Leptospira wolffii]|uniref:metallophosphoesterase family protein n=1 Tax=Leptospira wolffii TaxID=409998 RepID=UPI000344CF0E|nr:metallophosphoesterase [Leptospira wolffii]TGK56663.1 phosphohydrolase [Leptospira wolffii]TGK71755.1 phosphohydrolase [Leptospira wolffii]TGK75388.1 phosphohydrolase [Leptospira wolffii]TGL33122.1 phosphohydrolase [Leptospira wolffii]